MSEKKIIIDNAELIKKYLSKVLVVGTSSDNILSIGDLKSKKIFIHFDETNFTHFYKFIYNLINKDLKENGKNYTLEFLNCEFTLPFRLNSGLRKSYFPNLSFKFSSCVFQNFIFRDSVLGGKIEFNLSMFKNEIYLRDAIFKESAKFFSCTFKNKLYLENVTFEKLADFFNSTFIGAVNFYKTDFLGNVVFSAATFQKNILFTYSTIDGALILRDTKIKEGIDLSLAIINGKVNAFNIEIINKNFKVDNTKKLEETLYYEELVREKNVIPIKNKRETYKILKRELLNDGSVIDSLKYESLEKYVHLTERKTSFQSKLILSFNLVSNNFKKSIGLAFLFTAFISLFFYGLSIISTNKWMIDWSFSEFYFDESIFFEFLNPIHKPDYLIKHGYEIDDLNLYYYLADFFGRISVGFGYYQFIQAFRKFK